MERNSEAQRQRCLTSRSGIAISLLVCLVLALAVAPLFAQPPAGALYNPNGQLVSYYPD